MIEVELKTSVAPISEDARQKAIKNLEEWFLPMPAIRRLDLLSELRLKTSSKKMPYEDLIAQVKIYARDLEAFPASVVNHVLKTQPDISKWWPEWGLLKERMDTYCRKNKMALEALRNYNGPEALPSPKKKIDLNKIAETMKRYRENTADCQ